MAEKNYYEVLKVSRNASLEDIEQHYRALLYQVHPDHNHEDDASVDATIALVEAFRTLSDPQARKLYDFKINCPMLSEGEIKGIKLLKSKEKKEAEQRFAEGVRAFNLGELPKAVEAFKAALKQEPDYPEASYNLALLGSQLGNAHFSLEVLSRAIKLRSDDARLLKLRKAVSDTYLNI